MKYVPFLVLIALWIPYFFGLYGKREKPKPKKMSVQNFPDAFVINWWLKNDHHITVSCIINGKTREFHFMRMDFELYVDSVHHRQRNVIYAGSMHEDEHHVEMLTWDEYYEQEVAEVDVIHFLLHYPSF
jgi:hypothetical protein